METILIPVPGKSVGPLYRQLDELCSSARHLEEIFSRWIRTGQGIVVGLDKQSEVQKLAISFMLRGETVALAQIPLERLRCMYPNLIPLKETVIETEDENGFKPDDVWFDKRNSRLGVCVDEALDTNIAPPEAFVELVLSYALSSAGFVEIQPFSEEESGPPRFIKLSLVFLGLEDQQGWYETVLVDKRSVWSYLKQRSGPLH